MRLLLPLFTFLLIATPARAGGVLTLEEALRTARERQPRLTDARANTAAARARADQGFSSLLPQVGVSAAYRRSLLDGVGLSPTDPSSSFSRDGFSASATVSQLLFDFGRTPNRWRSAKQSAEAQGATEAQTLLEVLTNVRVAYFNVLAQQALVRVAEETLENQQAHLAQVRAQVEVGNRPEIDLSQQRTAVASAKLQLIEARSAEATSKAVLNQTLGVEGSTDYQVQEAVAGPVEGEEASIDSLVEVSLQSRPELAASEHQLQAQELQLSATRNEYWPSLSASVTGSNVSTSPTQMEWGVSGQLGLSWSLFQGGLTRAEVREQQARLSSLQAQRDTLRQQVRLEVERAWLSVSAARESVSVAEEVLSNARERLRLAEGRYRAGVGNIIELADAQLSASNAAVQRVRAVYDLSLARTELARALGREL